MNLTFSLSKRRNECGEFVVKGRCNGKRDECLDYFTDCWQDACDTLAAMRQHESDRQKDIAEHDAELKSV